MAAIHDLIEQMLANRDIDCSFSPYSPKYRFFVCLIDRVIIDGYVVDAHKLGEAFCGIDNKESLLNYLRTNVIN